MTASGELLHQIRDYQTLFYKDIHKIIIFRRSQRKSCSIIVFIKWYLGKVTYIYE